MTTLERSARYHLTVVLAAILACVILLVLFGPRVAPAGFALAALMALDPLLHREDDRDERDRQIIRRAGLLAGLTSYVYLIATCMGIWFARFRAVDPRIDVGVLPIIALGAWAVLALVWSVSVLVISRRPLEVGR